MTSSDRPSDAALDPTPPGDQLVERQDQLDLLRDAFDRAREGLGSAILIAGEAGIGKTSLIRAFQTELGDTARVLIGACEDLLASRPLGPFRDILRSADVEAPSLNEPEHRDSYLESMLDLMSRSLQPAVVVVEDAHWADDGSLDMIRYLGRRVEDMPALLVITYRTEAVAENRHLERTLGALASVRSVRMVLPGLSDEVVGRLVEAAGADPTKIVPLVAGNPFYLSEILAAPGSPLPATVREAVAARVLALPAETRDALELLAVVPYGASLQLIESIVGPPAILLEPAERARVVILENGLARFRHELARLSMEQSLSETRKISLNRLVLDELTATEVDPATLVHHAAAAHDTHAIVEYGPIAADRADFAEDHHGTVTLAAITLRNEDELPARVTARLHAHMAYAYYALNRFGDANTSAQTAVARWNECAPGSREHANTLLLSSRMRTMTGNPVAAREAIEEARAILLPMGTSRDLALSAAMLGNLNAIEARCAEALAWCGEAIDLADKVGADDVEALALIYRGLARVGLADLAGFDDFAKGVEIARRLDHGDFLSRGAGNAAAALIWLGRHPEALPYLDLAEEAARDHGLDYLLFHTAVQRSHVELFQGRWHSVEERLRDLAATEQDPAAVMILPLALLGRLLVRTGDPDGADMIDESWDMAVDTKQVYRMAVAGAAKIEKAWLEGNIDTVVSLSDVLLPLAESANLVYLRGEVLHYLMTSGIVVQTFPGCPEGFRAALEGDWEASVQAWGEAGNPYEQALAMCESPEVELAFDGLRKLDDLGAVAAAARFRKQMREKGITGIPRGPQRATREHPAPLTARQLEVLALVAAGMTSPEIAERLFISRRTVDNHIATVVARLGVSSRTQAADLAVAEGWVSG